MSNIPAGAWKRRWPKRWRVTPRRSMHYGDLIWRVYDHSKLRFSSVDLVLAMGTIEKYERGILK